MYTYILLPYLYYRHTYIYGSNNEKQFSNGNTLEDFFCSYVVKNSCEKKSEGTNIPKKKLQQSLRD